MEDSPGDGVDIEDVAVYDRVFPDVAMDTVLNPLVMVSSVVSPIADERTTLAVVDTVVLVVFDPVWTAAFIVIGDRGELVATLLISDGFVDLAVDMVNIIGVIVFSIGRFSVDDFKRLTMSVLVVAVNTTVDESDSTLIVASSVLLYVCAVDFVKTGDILSVLVESVDVAVFEAEIVPSEFVKVTDPVVGEVERLTIDGCLNKVFSVVATVSGDVLVKVVVIIVVLVSTREEAVISEFEEVTGSALSGWLSQSSSVDKSCNEENDVASGIDSLNDIYLNRKKIISSFVFFIINNIQIMFI